MKIHIRIATGKRQRLPQSLPGFRQLPRLHQDHTQRIPYTGHVLVHFEGFSGQLLRLFILIAFLQNPCEVIQSFWRPNGFYRFPERIFGQHQVSFAVLKRALDAVCKGIDDLPDHDPELRAKLKKELEEEGIESFGEKLKSLDPEYFEVVDLKNPNRLLRAVEVCLQTGKTYTSLRRNTPKPRTFNIIKIALNTDREILFERIGNRVDKMMERGLLEEVKALLPLREENALNTVGYKELYAYLDGKVSLEEAVEKIKTNTRRYAKRQLTWFKRDEEMMWFAPEEYGEVVDYLDSVM
jgi:hypothetical protein